MQSAPKFFVIQHFGPRCTTIHLPTPRHNNAPPCPPLPAMARPLLRVLYDFDAVEAGELTVRAGDLVHLVGACETV